MSSGVVIRLWVRNTPSIKCIGLNIYQHQFQPISIILADFEIFVCRQDNFGIFPISLGLSDLCRHISIEYCIEQERFSCQPQNGLRTCKTGLQTVSVRHLKVFVLLLKLLDDIMERIPTMEYNFFL